MKILINWVGAGLLALGALACNRQPAQTQATAPLPQADSVPPGYGSLPTLVADTLETDSLGRAFHLALGTMMANVRAARPNVQGMAAPGTPVLYAGIDYYGPWTRDASVSIWNGAGLLLPDVSQNTLLSLLDTSGGQQPQVGGQYWDRVLWIIAAWQQYLYNGDNDQLKRYYEIGARTMRAMEEAEYNDSLGLFRGPAVYGDGISAYPDLYTQTGIYTGSEWVSDITKWAHVDQNASLKSAKGFGLPMMALSTNCVYYQAYKSLHLMAEQLGRTADADYNGKAQALRSAIDRHFWMPDKNGYRYLIDKNAPSDRQEGMGYAFALLFDVATTQKAQTLLNSVYVSPAGIPCVYPTFERYAKLEPAGSYGRHSGTVWGQIKGLWGHAALRAGSNKLFMLELNSHMRMALRDGQFYELYHPQSGLPYGGWQEDNSGRISFWQSAKVQTWSATGFIRMVFFGLLGMEFKPDGLYLDPNFPKEWPHFELANLRYRNALISVKVIGKGKSVKRLSLNGQPATRAFVPSTARGRYDWEIELQ